MSGKTADDFYSKVPHSTLQHICSYLEINPETNQARYSAPKTKLETYPDYNDEETDAAHKIAKSAGVKLQIGESRSQPEEDNAFQCPWPKHLRGPKGKNKRTKERNPKARKNE